MTIINHNFLTRYCYYYYYYYERICLLAQHAESSTDHLGLSRACLDLDSRHAKTGSQSPLGQRCLTHPTHPRRGHVALNHTIHSEMTKVLFFIARRTDSETNPTHRSFHCDSICSVPRESTPLRPPTPEPQRSLTDVILEKYVYLELITCMSFL